MSGAFLVSLPAGRARRVGGDGRSRVDDHREQGAEGAADDLGGDERRGRGRGDPGIGAVNVRPMVTAGLANEVER